MKRKIAEWVLIGAISISMAIGGMLSSVQRKHQADENQALKKKLHDKVQVVGPQSSNMYTIVYPNLSVPAPVVKVVVVKQVQPKQQNPVIINPVTTPTAPTLPEAPTLPTLPPTPEPKGLLCKNLNLCL